MSGNDQLPEGPQGSSSDRPSEGGPSRRGRRIIRRPGMSEEERRDREQRRLRLQDNLRSEDKEEKESGDIKETDEFTLTHSQAIELAVQKYEPRLTEAESNEEPKPWETLVIGDLGENLSRIETKNREIARQWYIVKYHEKNSPHEVPHNQEFLEELLQERSEIVDNEENNMPEEQREENNRIGERLELLNWALDTCQCEGEEVNIRAAIEGYQSGEIAYSENFTLIYAGHIVDVCPTYRSFCEDREERLDRYFGAFGPGWLWQEPPLAGAGFGPVAKKGMCLERRLNHHRDYGIGLYPINQKYTVDKRLVMRATADDKKTKKTAVSSYFTSLLDSGATFSSLVEQDLKLLKIDFKYYASQGVMEIMGINNIKSKNRYFEMFVSPCSKDGKPLVGDGDQAVWPNEPRALGGFFPVWISDIGKNEVRYLDRLSGMVPFDVCYMSSAPTMRELWLGEDRRDVLGARRMPALLRYDPLKILQLDCQEDIQKHRDGATTPDQVMFIHNIDDNGKRVLSDGDWQGTRGKNEIAIIEREFDEQHRQLSARMTDSVVLEPRQNPYRSIPSDTRKWREHFLTVKQILEAARAEESRVEGASAEPKKKKHKSKA
ncbi:hypothetical protein F5Y04DRAFT_287266 [Hypomontagnella monticulosa]|nr:hypothetical protein F5Y04DRAFT_287266 [Hypomontagnella monticulosa]